MTSPMARHIQKTIKDNLPQILSGVAAAGVIGTAVLAIKATPKAQEAIVEAKQEKEYAAAGDEERSIVDQSRLSTWDLTLLETVKATWRAYLPTTLCGAATIACIFGANAIGFRRNAAILAAYTLVDTNFREYKDKVVEHVTAQKAQKIDDEIMDERIQKNPPTKSEMVIFTGGGDQLCYESLTGRYFKSNAETIRRAANDIDTRILQSDMYAPANEFFRELGLDPTALGTELGWTIECRLNVVFSSHITPENVPALAVGYEKLPIFNYESI